jgi:hypothetical protein
VNGARSAAPGREPRSGPSGVPAAPGSAGTAAARPGAGCDRSQGRDPGPGRPGLRLGTGQVLCLGRCRGRRRGRRPAQRLRLRRRPSALRELLGCGVLLVGATATQPVEDGPTPLDEVVLGIGHRCMLPARPTRCKQPSTSGRGTGTVWTAVGVFHVEHRASRAGSVFHVEQSGGEPPLDGGPARPPPPLFHVERSEEGTLGRDPGTAGEPIRAGHRLPERLVGPVASPARPGLQADQGQPSAGHRSRSSGGSLTTRTPPTRSSGAAHSATTAGGPKLRATTASTPARSGPRPASSARWCRTSTRSPSPSSATASSRTAQRRAAASSSTSCHIGRATARTRPGTPPPAPRSTTWAGSRREAVEEPEGVVDLVPHRGGAEQPVRPGPLQHPMQRVAGIEHVVGAGRGGGRPRRAAPVVASCWRRAGHSGRITTRRRASSPSDTVVTPSISFTTSWTILRSGGDMGSSAVRVPDSLTWSAT